VYWIERTWIGRVAVRNATTLPKNEGFVETSEWDEVEKKTGSAHPYVMV